MEEARKKILALARECVEQGKGERPENRWLKARYEKFRQAMGMGKAEADTFIYTKMYGGPPEKASDTLKIRYWRTGRHLPASREQCVAFGHAMELSDLEMAYLIQAYYDRSITVFEEESDLPAYQERRRQMEEMTREYLDKIHPVIRRRMYRFGNDLERSLRHLYFTDAKGYLDARSLEETEVERHITSVNYESEFSRQLKLLGEIPRKTMIRHIILFGMPFISRELLNERLQNFGYLPLNPKHTQVDGSRLDRLVLGMLKIYEDNCRGREPQECTRWFHQAYRVLDSHLEAEGNGNLRFLYFKALKGNE